MQTWNTFKKVKLLVLLYGILSVSSVSAQNLHHIVIESPQELKDFFRYVPDRIPIISTHRGGSRPGYPENCIHTFENTLRHTWSILEIDPRYTQDSIMVLMHDATLDRTSTGNGKVSDYTYAELQELRLKDSEGNRTPFKIPTLDETIIWAKGKTILIIDQKDVPLEHTIRKIQEHRAQAWAAPIVYGGVENIQKALAMEPDLVMEVMIPDVATLQKIEAANIPLTNLIAFTTHTEAKDPTLYEQLHKRGIMAIRGSSRTIDRAFLKGEISTRKELEERYREMIVSGTDIIEADLGIEAGNAIQPISPANSSKRKYFKKD